MDKEIREFAMSCINTVGWWLVHIAAAANGAPEEAMRRASAVESHPLNDYEDIEDLDDDTDEDE